MLTGCVVENSGVGLEQCVVQRRRSETKKRVWVYHERRLCLIMKIEDWSENGPVVPTPEPPGTRRLRGGQNAQRMRGRDLNIRYIRELESRMNSLHSRKQMRYKILVGGSEDLIPDCYVVDQSGGVKGENIVGNPRLGGGELGEGGNVTVSDGDGEGDAGAGEGTENIGVGVKDLDAVDGSAGFEESGDLGRGRKVVGNGAVVDADGICGGGKGNEEEEEEEEREKERVSHGRGKEKE